jgi:hypothetical protein
MRKKPTTSDLIVRSQLIASTFIFVRKRRNLNDTPAYNLQSLKCLRINAALPSLIVNRSTNFITKTKTYALHHQHQQQIETMSIPPQLIRVKRKRDDESPVTFLRMPYLSLHIRSCNI